MKKKKYDLNSTLLIGTKYTSTVSIKYIHKWFLKPLLIKAFLFLSKVFLFRMSLICEKFNYKPVFDLKNCDVHFWR